MNDISLMVLDTVQADANNQARPGQNQFLLEQKGLWRQMLPGDQMLPPSQLAEYRTQVDKKLKNIMTTIASTPETVVMPAMKILGADLYRKLLPPGLQVELRSVADAAPADTIPILRVHSTAKVDWIPWEIMHDGNGFLGLRFQIARFPICPKGPSVNGNVTRTVHHIVSLIGEHVVRDAALEKWKTTFTMAADKPTVQVHMSPSGPAWQDFPATSLFDDVLGTQNIDPDILHITCHGGMSDEGSAGQIYWTLNHKAEFPDGYRIDIPIVQYMGDQLGLSQIRPLVFGNACWSASTSMELLSPSSFGEAFFKEAALNFIGTFAPLTESLAVEFACEFYKRLLSGDGMTVGMALCKTKDHFATKAGQKDPCYLFYCLYGPPDTKFVLATG